MTNFKRLFLLSFVFLTFSGCAMIKSRLAMKDCKFRIANIEAVEYNPLQDLDKVNVKLNIDCMNPNNAIEAVLDKLVFNLLLNGKNVADGKITDQLRVGPQKTVSFPVSIGLSLSKIGKTALEAIQSNKAAYELKGTAFFSTILGETSIPVTITKGKWSGEYTVSN
ncbi:MAG: LEA type 2 family protein [bacterium]|nr:LEA type 2 family protein [bacterium]